MLKGKIAIVTGSTSGIGLGIARALAAQGAGIMLNGFGSPAQIDELAAREKLGIEQAKVRLLGEKQPSLQFTTPEQIAALAVFLCSESALQIRGAALPVDGGWVAQ